MKVTMLVALMLAACTSGTAQGEVTVSACGTTARLRKGQTLVVRLESQITTGYAWGVAAPAPEIVSAIGEPEIERDDRDVDGGSEVQVFRFSAAAAGSGTLTFHNRRSWEKDKPALKTCTFNVEVAE